MLWAIADLFGQQKVFQKTGSGHWIGLMCQMKLSTSDSASVNRPKCETNLAAFDAADKLILIEQLRGDATHRAAHSEH